MRAIQLFLYLLLLIPSFCLGNEGFWLPLHLERLRGVDLQIEGLHLTNEEIYSINQSSLKDAVVSFNGYCSGEVISKTGLVLTNFHCALTEIQQASTKEHNLFEQGFWALDSHREIPGRNSQVTFLVRMEDVTEEVLSKARSADSEKERLDIVNTVTKEIVAGAVGDTHYNGEVKSFFYGNEYYLFIYETFEDIRLVGTPPESIGQFGGDKDNWEWPNHTADFALFRIYADTDGKPAPYSISNKPLATTHHLPISIGGVQEGAATLVMGYPAKSMRSSTSQSVRYSIDHSSRYKQDIFTVKNKVYQNLLQNQVLDHKYPLEFMGLKNYEKFYRGQEEVLKDLKVIKSKETHEELLRSHSNLQPDQLALLEKIEKNIDGLYQKMAPLHQYNLYLVEGVFSSGLLLFTYHFSSLYQPLVDKYPKQAYEEKIEKLEQQTKRHFNKYQVSSDQKMTAAMLALFYNRIPPEQQPETIRKLGDRYQGDFDKWCSKLFRKSIFSDSVKVCQFLNNPDLKTLSKDPAYKFMRDLVQDYYGKVAYQLKDTRFALNKIYRTRHRILRNLESETIPYPEANGTLRVSFGKIKSFTKFNGSEQNSQTTLSELIEKCQLETSDYQVPEQLISLYKSGQYGRYAEKGDIPIAFLTDNDISSGSSGSPVLNGRGELIGIVSDSNWEALAGDFKYSPEFQRSINIDIRYVLFIIDKFAGAKSLVDEMTITSKFENTGSR